MESKRWNRRSGMQDEIKGRVSGGIYLLRRNEVLIAVAVTKATHQNLRILE